MTAVGFVLLVGAWLIMFTFSPPKDWKDARIWHWFPMVAFLSGIVLTVFGIAKYLWVMLP